MTALVWSLQANEVVILSDTLMTTGDGEPAAFVQKIHPLPHLGVVFSGRGDGELITLLAPYISYRMLARGYDTLVELVPDMLRQKSASLWAEIEGELPGTTSIFMWGWSESAGRICGTAFRSGSGFAPEPMQDGTVTAPGIDNPALMNAMHGDNPFAAMIDIMREQYREARASPMESRCQIGGDIMVQVMTATAEGACAFQSQSVHRFDTYEAEYEQALDRLDADFRLLALADLLRRWGR